MRTTLNLDPAALAAAKKEAKVRSVSLGKAVSDLIRRGLSRDGADRFGRTGSGFPVFKVPANAAPLTAEDVKRDEDEA